MEVKMNTSDKATVKMRAGQFALRVASITLLASGMLATTGCRYDGNLSGMHWFLDMHDNSAVEAQEEDTTTLAMVKGDDWQHGGDSNPAFGGPGSAMRVPPEGTVPRSSTPYKYGVVDIVEAGNQLKNPLPASKEVLTRGRKMYDIYCAVCHGYQGLSDGPVVPPFPKPPMLAGAAASSRAWKDGMIFHMITVGRGLMKPYAAQLNESDRWAIVNYIRLLQQSSK